MTYTSPLHIFKNQNIQGVDEDSLKKLKKELLLKFELTHSTTIKLYGKEYDKATVLELFDDLKKDSVYHFRVFKNKELLNFLENGNLKFFQVRSSWKDLQIPDFRNWVEPYFTKQLSDRVTRCVNHKGIRSINDLKKINNSKFPFPAGMKDQVYSEAFAVLNIIIKTGRLKTIDPFVGQSDNIFRQEVKEVFNPHYINILKVLPKDIFQSIVKDYSAVGRHVLAKAFYKERLFQDFQKGDLRILLTATDVCLYNNPKDEEIKKLAKDMRSVLYGDGSSSGGGDVSVWWVVKFILLLFLVIARMATCSNGSRSADTGFNNDNSIQLRDVPNYKHKDKMYGTWESTFQMGKQMAWVKRTLIYNEDKSGHVKWQILNDDLSELCFIERPFKWGITHFGKKQDILKSTALYNIEYNYATDLPTQQNCEAVSTLYSDILVRIEKELSKKYYTIEKFNWKLNADSGQAAPVLFIRGKEYVKMNDQ